MLISSLRCSFVCLTCVVLEWVFTLFVVFALSVCLHCLFASCICFVCNVCVVGSCVCLVALFACLVDLGFSFACFC